MRFLGAVIVYFTSHPEPGAQGLTASLEAIDAMLKFANVSLFGKEKIGAAHVFARPHKNPVAPLQK